MNPSEATDPHSLHNIKYAGLRLSMQRGCSMGSRYALNSRVEYTGGVEHGECFAYSTMHGIDKQCTTSVMQPHSTLRATILVWCLALTWS